MLVFISWSGPRSKYVAEALESWLAQVIQAVEPWISQDMDKGLRWSAEIADRLEHSKVGIICLTKSNLDSKWLHFEAGALSKTKDARVCTLLLDMKPTEVGQPLGQFQHTMTEKEQIFKLLQTINREVEKTGEKALTEPRLRDVFETYWPRLNEALQQASALEETMDSPSRSEREMLQEALEILRNQERRQNRLQQINEPSRTADWLSVESAVLDWLKRQYPERVTRAGRNDSADFVIEDSEGALIGVEVKAYTKAPGSMASVQIDSATLKLQRRIDEGRFAKGLVVLAATSLPAAARLNSLIDGLDTPGIAYTIGIIGEAGEFEALRSTPFDL